MHGDSTGTGDRRVRPRACLHRRVSRPCGSALPAPKVVLEHVHTRDAVQYFGLRGTSRRHYLSPPALEPQPLFWRSAPPYSLPLPSAREPEARSSLLPRAPNFLSRHRRSPHARNAKELRAGCAGITAPARAICRCHRFRGGRRPRQAGRLRQRARRAVLWPGQSRQRDAGAGDGAFPRLSPWRRGPGPLRAGEAAALEADYRSRFRRGGVGRATGPFARLNRRAEMAGIQTKRPACAIVRGQDDPYTSCTCSSRLRVHAPGNLTISSRGCLAAFPRPQGAHQRQAAARLPLEKGRRGHLADLLTLFDEGVRSWPARRAAHCPLRASVEEFLWEQRSGVGRRMRVMGLGHASRAALSLPSYCQALILPSPPTPMPRPPRCFEPADDARREARALAF